MDNNEISYKTLRKIQDLEKKSPVFTKVGLNFYHDVLDYLEKLKDRLKKETSNQKVMLLRNEIRSTYKIIENIYEIREKKILLAVISKARGGNPDIKNLVDVEKDIFDSIIDIVINSRNKIICEKQIQNVKKNSKSVDYEKNNENNENYNPIVVITDNLPEFIGTDTKKYHLRKGDFISLKKDMSDTLVKRGVAKKINNKISDNL